MEETSISAGVAERLDKLGLQREPFLGAGAEELYFTDPGARQRLDLLHHLAPYSQLLLVTGEAGVGKSALMRRFLSRANESWRACLVQAQPDMDAQALMQAVCAGFGLAGEESGELQATLHALTEHLRTLRYNSQIPLLIIDNAGNLANSGLELVRDLCEAGSDGILVGIILLGDATLNARLNQSEFDGLPGFIAHRFELQSLSEEDTAAYLHFRMSAAGFTGESPFTAPVIKRIYRASRGIPARINEFAHDVLIDEMVRKSDMPPTGPRSARPVSQGRWALVGVGVAAIGLILWWQGRGVPPAPHKDEQTQKSVTVSLPPPAPAPVEGTAPPPPPAADITIPQGDSAATVPAAGTAPAKSAEQIAQAPPQRSPSKPAEPPASPMPVTAPVPVAKVEPAPSKVTVTTPESARVSHKEPPSPKASHVVPPHAKPKQVVPAKAAVAKNGGATASIEAGGSKGEGWLQAQDPNHYTVQLIAVHDEATVRDFITTHRLQDDAAYFSVERGGQTYYALVYGSYPTRAQAEAAARELPAELSKLGPWVRTLGSAQAAHVHH